MFNDDIKDEETGLLQPAANFLAQQLADFPEMKSEGILLYITFSILQYHIHLHIIIIIEMPLYEITEFAPLLDSSDMSHEDWHNIAKLIETRYFEFDGFVVIHGILFFSNFHRIT